MPLSRRLRLALAASTLLGASLLGACAGHVIDYRPDPRVVVTDTAYTSGGARVAVERMAFEPASGAAPNGSRAAARARRPAVLVLHPSDGVAGSGAQYVRRYAQELALNGYVAYVVHYFDRTGDVRTDDPREDAMFPQWTAALQDAVTFAQHDPAVDPARVGAFGYSLGAWMALALGAEDRRVGAIVGIGSGFFDALRPRVRREPPTLLLHGAQDDVVPLARALAVDSTLRRLGVPHRLVVYPGQKHGLDEATDPDGRARTVRWFNRELRGRRAAGTSVATAPAPNDPAR